MLQILYILAFSVIAFIAIGNLIKSIINLGMDSQKHYGAKSANYAQKNINQRVTHPELLDEQGKPINEPLLVMRSISVEDARQKLDALYDASPNHKEDN